MFYSLFFFAFRKETTQSLPGRGINGSNPVLESPVCQWWPSIGELVTVFRLRGYGRVFRLRIFRGHERGHCRSHYTVRV